MNRVKGISLDAFGTILELQPPALPLIAELRDGWGIEVSEEQMWRAFAAEMSYYKAHHLEGHDPDSLADLRLRSTAVLLENLPEDVQGRVGADDLLPAMMRSLRFRAYPDVPGALRRLRSRGLSVVVVSNWDISLHGFVADSGLGPLVDHVVSSAEVGAGKPAPEPFARGLELLGLDPSEVIHVGDDPDHDVAGARAAGIAPVLIRRSGGSEPPPEGVPVIGSLGDLSLLL